MTGLRMSAGSGAAALVLCTPWSEASWRLNSVDLGGATECFDCPIFIDGAFYQHELGDNYPPPSFFLDFAPDLRFDSYVLMDSNGPTTPIYSASAPGGAVPPFGPTEGFFSAEGRFWGGYFTAGGAPAGPDPWGGHGVMIAQLTMTGSFLRPFGFHVYASGELDGFFSVGNDESPLAARIHTSHRDLEIDGVRYNVNQLWVTDTPTPGTSALLLAGLLAWRRRR